MIVWRITGNEIGPNGNGAAHFSLKADAEARLREFNKEAHPDAHGDGPEKIEVKGREDLARALDDAMGYGVS